MNENPANLRCDRTRTVPSDPASFADVCDTLRAKSKSRQERGSEIRSKVRSTFDQFAQFDSHAALELAGRTGCYRSIAGRLRNSNQRVRRDSRRIPLISSTDSIRALQTRARQQDGWLTFCDLSAVHHAPFHLSRGKESKSVKYRSRFARESHPGARRLLVVATVLDSGHD